MESTTARAAAADLALAAYEPLAPFYDRFTAESKYEPVLDAIETWARAQGLRGTRLLDVACGTGKSFEPLLARGYEVSACDLSPAMVAEAQRNWAGVAEIVVADMRSLPWRSEFDLVTCVDDAVNYMLEEEDLRAALSSMARALRPEGIAVFDANTLLAYRTDWAESFDFTAHDARFHWRGECSAEAAPGAIARATVTVTHAGGSCESRHVQRHWRVEELRAACLAAGFRHVVFRGLAEGPRLAGEPDEERHLKLVCLAARPAAAS
ncbi:MAG TPA: methyltransferase domain-containing protein [Thermoleophilaceae bacterium]